MIKDIVVNVSVVAPDEPAAAYAASLAAAFRAHLTGLAFCYDPVISPVITGGVLPEMIDSQRSENERAAAAALDRFEQAARSAGVESQSRIVNASLAGAVEVFGKTARSFDLAVIGQPMPDSGAPEELLVEGAMFESGRPVIVVPFIQREALKLDHVIVGWDGSRAASRAMADAMPLLERAGRVVVLTVGHRPEDDGSDADIERHLARHGVKSERKYIVADDIDVASAILSYAADESADLIVMGGYGHSRLREFLLGGATRGILGSMTMPTLMSH